MVVHMGWAHGHGHARAHWLMGMDMDTDMVVEMDDMNMDAMVCYIHRCT